MRNSSYDGALPPPSPQPRTARFLDGDGDIDGGARAGEGGHRRQAMDAGRMGDGWGEDGDCAEVRAGGRWRVSGC